MDEYMEFHVCVDCYRAHHYGVARIDDQWFTEGSDTPCDCEPLGLLSDVWLTDPGDQPEGWFSWGSCEGCGSRLGGDRFVLMGQDWSNV